MRVGKTPNTTSPHRPDHPIILCKSFNSIRDLEAPTMGRTMWVGRLNREIINNFLLHTEEDVINNKHPRYYNHTNNTQMLDSC